MLQLGVTLCQGHGTLGLVGQTPGIEQRGDMDIIADGLGGTVLGRAGSIPETYLIAELISQKSMHLHTKVEACTDTRSDSIQRVGQDGHSCE